MDIIKKAFPLTALIMFQLLVIALFNLSINIPHEVFAKGTMVSWLLPINIILLTLTFISVAVINNTFKNLEEEIENKLRMESQEQLKELLHTMRGQRHDFNHHLQTVYGFLSVDAHDEAKQYLEESIAQISVANEMIRSDNPGLNALLYVKSGEMERYGIGFSLDIQSSINSPLKPSELNAVVGNLLDNGIQKLSSTRSLNPQIVFEACQRGGLLILGIKDNGASVEPLHLDKLFLPGFSTKSNGQGLGLYNVKQILEKYGGEIQVENDNGLTTFRVLLPL
ncbi:Signal transduction histidine kinase, sporulation regulator SpoOB [Desulfitobacterium hafniense]|uniref:histidine kinase n=1 Tax=Desulfitobacterium hafniense TaxID=49338 RepID=A0A098B170_DESHA|nr:ATP-binding protein [Desulfitobacterium hafniense]CDX02624.1 Signal transduction histidine kinase, sporulation regulator SpoOB [Desulfitobacterium hafniense]